METKQLGFIFLTASLFSTFGIYDGKADVKIFCPKTEVADDVACNGKAGSNFYITCSVTSAPECGEAIDGKETENFKDATHFFCTFPSQECVTAQKDGDQ